MIYSLLLLLWTSLFPSIIRILLPILMWLMVRWMTGTMVMMMVMRSSFWSSSYPKWCWSEWIIFMWPEVRSYMLFEHLFTLVSIEWVEIIIFSDLYNWKSNKSKMQCKYASYLPNWTNKIQIVIINVVNIFFDCWSMVVYNFNFFLMMPSNWYKMSYMMLNVWQMMLSLKPKYKNKYQ